MRPAAVGDDGFVESVGEMPTLWFKKGAVALKVNVYAKRAPDALQALELALRLGSLQAAARRAPGGSRTRAPNRPTRLPAAAPGPRP